jgi:CRISPR/Cas system Type II protein with McrA/HNH and RuvC-like nuclease domain
MAKADRSLPPTITGKQIMSMIKEQKFRCALTGRELTPETASADHIMPLSRDGDHSISNIWIVHHRVNTAKGTMTMEEFIEMCREVVSHADARLTTPRVP